MKIGIPISFITSLGKKIRILLHAIIVELTHNGNLEMLRYTGKIIFWLILTPFACYGIFSLVLNFSAPVSREYSQRYSSVKIAQMKIQRAKEDFFQELKLDENPNLLLGNEKEFRRIIKDKFKERHIGESLIFLHLEEKKFGFFTYLPLDVEEHDEKYFLATCLDLSDLFSEEKTTFNAN